MPRVYKKTCGAKLNIRLSPDLFKALEETAARMGISYSEYIRRSVSEQIELDKAKDVLLSQFADRYEKLAHQSQSLR